MVWPRIYGLFCRPAPRPRRGRGDEALRAIRQVNESEARRTSTDQVLCGIVGRARRVATERNPATVCRDGPKSADPTDLRPRR